MCTPSPDVPDAGDVRAPAPLSTWARLNARLRRWWGLVWLPEAPRPTSRRGLLGEIEKRLRRHPEEQRALAEPQDGLPLIQVGPMNYADRVAQEMADLIAKRFVILGGYSEGEWCVMLDDYRAADDGEILFLGRKEDAEAVAGKARRIVAAAVMMGLRAARGEDL